MFCRTRCRARLLVHITSDTHNAICIAFVGFSFRTLHDVRLDVGRVAYPDYCNIACNLRKMALNLKITCDVAVSGPVFRMSNNLTFDNYCCCCWVLRHFLTSQVISVASDIDRENSDKFCSEALISA